MKEFDVITQISDIEEIAIGDNIREFEHLNRQFGSGRWRKIKGFAVIQMFNGAIWFAEVHCYEVDGRWQVYKKIKELITLEGEESKAHD